MKCGHYTVSAKVLGFPDLMLLFTASLFVQEAD
jgi:hypothetical protein